VGFGLLVVISMTGAVLTAPVPHAALHRQPLAWARSEDAACARDGGVDNILRHTNDVLRLEQG
jgi:hypothetical protein